MSNNTLDEYFVRSCTMINTSNKYHLFLEKLNEKQYKQKSNTLTTEEFFESNDSSAMEKSKRLLHLITQNNDTEKVLSDKILNKLLISNSQDFLIAATALYLINKKSEDDTYWQALFLMPDPFSASTIAKIAEDASYYFIQLMGCSTNPSFIPLLYEILTKHYHFYSQSYVANALINLEITPDEDEIPYTRSMTVTAIDSKIILYTDDKYMGHSNCPDCDFFPCRINHYYAGGIEDCNLWNQTNPNSLERIEDKRDWGDHLVTEKVTQNEQRYVWNRARKLMSQKLYCEAIPLLCATLLFADQLAIAVKSSTTPLAWIYLSHCFSVLGEKKLAFIAMREALVYENLVPPAKKGEKRQLKAFNNNPVSILGATIGKKINTASSIMQVVNFRKQYQWVKAFDYYVDDAILNQGKQAADWFHMGECHRELEEYHLAELFMRKAVNLSEERGLRDKFLLSAIEIHTILSKLNHVGAGLSMERRRQERKLVEKHIVFGFNLATYEFETISDAAKKETKYCSKIRDFFGLAEKAYLNGTLNLAIEIMHVAVNFAESYGAKAIALSMTARLHVGCHQYDKAVKCLDWAIMLKPDENKFKELRKGVIKSMGLC